MKLCLKTLSYIKPRVAILRYHHYYNKRFAINYQSCIFLQYHRFSTNKFADQTKYDKDDLHELKDEVEDEYEGVEELDNFDEEEQEIDNEQETEWEYDEDGILEWRAKKTSGIFSFLY